MATAALDVLHTAALRLREAADRFVVAFEKAAGEAAGAPSKRTAEPVARKRLTSPGAVQAVALAGTDRGVTAAEVARVFERSPRAVSGRLCSLADRGHLIRVALPGQQVRFFAHAEHATAWGASGGPPALEVHSSSEYPSGAGAFPERRPTPEVCDLPAVPQLAAMFEADAPAVAAALAVIAPEARPADPPLSTPRPAPYIPPTPSMARGERRQQLTEAAFVAPVAKPTGEPVEATDVKKTVVNAPAYDMRFGVDPKTVSADPKSFSAEWKRLRGEGAGA